MRRRCRVGGLLGIVAAIAVGCGESETPAPTAGADSAPISPAPSNAADLAVPESERRPVVAETLPYGEVDEKLVYGYFAIPEDMIEPLPAVIVVHDWWGLDGHMQETVERLAGEGYIALGVDLFAGETAASLAEARTLEIEVVENPDLAIENLKQAYDFVANAAGAPRVAILGYGFGGGWSLLATSEMAGRLGASISYYGQVHDDRNRLALIDAPFLGLFAENDRAVTKDAVERFEESLDALQKQVEIVSYRDRRRGFANPQSQNFDAATAEDAWQRVIRFLGATMSAAEP